MDEGLAAQLDSYKKVGLLDHLSRRQVPKVEKGLAGLDRGQWTQVQ